MISRERKCRERKGYPRERKWGFLERGNLERESLERDLFRERKSKRLE